MWENVRKIFTGEEKIEITDEYRQILADFESGTNIFITGKAGSGKSKLIEYIRNSTKKKVAVLAPTGLAALNIKGQTIHSFFKLPPRVLTSETVARLRSNEEVFEQLEAIIIDEVSMVRADVMDAIDRILKRYGRDRHLPFGGVQVVLVGDVFQLPPVVANEEKEVFEMHYELPYFFGSAAFINGDFEVRVLSRIFRQAEEKFIEALNRIRNGDVEIGHVELINSRVGKRADNDKSVLLAATNALVNQINATELSKIASEEKLYVASVEGEFNHEERSLPVEKELKLKKGARVVILKNGPGWVNGSMGVVSKLTDESVTVRLDENGNEIELGTEEWDNIAYRINRDTNEIEETKLGSIRQLPIRLAWAVTIHKSQGMSFDRVYIDLTSSPFAFGQTYVALSRCRKLEGLTLSRKLFPKDILVDPRVIDFASRFSK